MAAQRTSFEKLQRDRAKKAKAAAKREKRLDKSPEEGAEDEELMRPRRAGHRAHRRGAARRGWRRSTACFEAKKISFEDFEEQKADLMARISVD